MRRPPCKLIHVLAPVATAVVLVATTLYGRGGHANPQHMDMARALLQGSVWIDRPTTTHDLGEIRGRWFSPFPPLPAFVAAGALLISGDPDVAYYAAVLLAALAAVALAWKIGRRLGGPVAGAWASLVLGLGSGLWIALALHDSYHSAHVFAALGTLGALAAVLARRPRWALAGLLLGLAALARQSVILGLPFLLLLRRGKETQARHQATSRLFLAGALPFSIYLALNTARFGTPLTTGYAVIHHNARLEEDLQAHGAFSLAYVPRNVSTMLVALPRVVPRFPFVLPDPAGLSLLLVSPWVLLAFVPLFKPDRPGAQRMARACVLAGLTIAVPHLIYVNTGWAQFGYRFALDEMPFLLAAAVLAVRRWTPLVPGVAATWSCAVHAWGFIVLRNWAEWGSLLGSR